MQTNQLVNVALSDKSKVDELLATLDDIARSYEHWEFGLPLHNEPSMAQMREAIYIWLLSIQEVAQNVT